MMAIAHDLREIDRFLVELVTARLDAREIEDFVDQIEQCTPELWMSPAYSL